MDEQASSNESVESGMGFAVSSTPSAEGMNGDPAVIVTHGGWDNYFTIKGAVGMANDIMRRAHVAETLHAVIAVMKGQGLPEETVRAVVTGALLELPKWREVAG